MTVKERLIEYLKDEKIQQIDFCSMLGVSKAYVSSMSNSMQPDKIKLIAEKFPHWNIKYLLTGLGNRYLTESNIDPIDSYKEEILQAKNEVISTLQDMIKLKDEEIVRLKQEIAKNQEKIEKLQKTNEKLVFNKENNSLLCSEKNLVP